MPTGIIVELLELFVKVLGKGYGYFTRKLKEKQRKKELEKVAGPVATLAVMIGESAAIRADVMSFIKDERYQPCKDLTASGQTAEDSFYSIVVAETIDFADEGKKDKAINSFESQLYTISKAFKEKGIKRIHLFYCGPAVLMGKIGAEFSNRITVFAYQYNKNLEPYYFPAGPLE